MDAGLSPGEIALLTEHETLHRPGGGLGVTVTARFEVRDGWLKRWWAKLRGRA